MKIGILAVQGAFIEHEKRLKALGAKCVQLRQKADLTDIDGLVLPGGESTVQGQLMRELDLFETLKEKIEGGLPVLATCAGLILLSQKISNDDNVYFGTLPVTTKRNAYGRQLGSFQVTEQFEGIGEVPMTFIRAPYIEQVNSPDVEILSKYDGKITGVRYKNQIALSFHPELDQDERIHRYFLGTLKRGY